MASSKHQRAATLESAALEKPTSLWEDAWHRLLKNRAATAGLITFICITLLCLVGPFLSPYGEAQQERTLGSSAPFATIIQSVSERGGRERIEFTSKTDFIRQARLYPDRDVEAILAALAKAPSFEFNGVVYSIADRTHILGTDGLGRDMLTRIMTGGRISLMVGFLATAVSLCIGVIYGATAGFVGGRLDAVMMRIVDILYALPFTIFVILLMVLFGRHIWLLFLAIGAVEWLTMARIVRGQVVSLKRQEFIEASVAMGQKQSVIIGRHIIPNVLGVVIVYSTLTVPSVIMLESFLSFLGLGVQPPSASWGTLIKEGAESMEVFPWQLLFPALIFSSTLLSLNFLGDGLRDALDPKNSPK